MRAASLLSVALTDEAAITHDHTADRGVRGGDGLGEAGLSQSGLDPG